MSGARLLDRLEYFDFEFLRVPYLVWVAGIVRFFNRRRLDAVVVERIICNAK